MPTGSFSIDVVPSGISSNALVTGVFRYAPPIPQKASTDGNIPGDPDEDEDEEEEEEEEENRQSGGGQGADPGRAIYSLIPNVTWLRIDNREGPYPPVCQLSYIQSNNAEVNLGWPSQFEDLWPIDVPSGPYVIHNDDRIVVLSQNPDNSTSCLFDGHAQIPQVDLASANHNVTFTAINVAARCWDFPIGGRVQRNSDAVGIVDTSGKSDLFTNLPTRFNPADDSIARGNKGGYRPNKTPDKFDTSKPPALGSPCFVDERVVNETNPPAYWSISDAVQYLLAKYNASARYVKNPEATALKALLQADYSTDDDGIFDEFDFLSADILIRDYDASNKPWPEVMADFLNYAGFVMRFDTSMSSDGQTTQTELKIYRRDAAATAAPKRIFLDKANSQLDTSRNNTSQLSLARDCNVIANAWKVETPSRNVEATFQLAPLFVPIASDVDPVNQALYLRSGWTPTTTAVVRRAYRWFGVDELGEGYWDEQKSEFTTAKPFDLSPLFPDNDDGSATYVNRYRPGANTIISLDTQGRPLKTVLHIWFPGAPGGGLTGVIPQVLTGGIGSGLPTKNIFVVPNGSGWKLLDNQLGIELTNIDVNKWHFGNEQAANAGHAAMIEWFAQPDPKNKFINGKPPIFFLTTVIQDDFSMQISAGKRLASPTVFQRIKIADAKDHFQFNTVAVGSFYYEQDGGDGVEPWVARDDTAAAITHAKQLRAANEMPSLAGSITIPFISQYYEVGDRLWKISGRDVSLQTNIGASQGESPDYPWIVGVSWTNDNDRQSTAIQISDHRKTVKNL